MKTINPSELSPMQVQMILQTAVAPRPIALASTGLVRTLDTCYLATVKKDLF